MTPSRLTMPILLSILAALVTLGLKWTAYYLTGSVGLLSDAVESMLNLVAALAALFSLWYASRPVDPTHTYGHEKIEYFSSGLEGAFITAAAGGIAWYAVKRLLAPVLPEALGLGAVFTVIASVINLGVSRLLLRASRIHQSIVLEADGRHLMTDVWASAAVLLGLGLVWLTETIWLDPMLGLLVSVYIAWTGADLIWRSFNGLMDHALPAEEQVAVRAAISGRLQPGMDFHALRTRRAGRGR